MRLPSGKVTYRISCVCDCGQTREVFVWALIQGKTGSCGCDKSRYTKTTGERNYAFKGFKEIRFAYWNIIRSRAAARSIPFELTIEYAWGLYEQQHRLCALSGVGLAFGVNAGSKPSNTTASLDRIDNSKGYVEGNVQWVHKTINLMRNVLPVGDFKDWCKRVALWTGAHVAESSCKQVQA